MDQFIEAITEIANTTVFLKCEPEIIDFRNSYEGKIEIWTETYKLVFPIIHDRLDSFISILFNTVFAKGMTVIAWDIKRLFSFIRYQLPRRCERFRQPVIQAQIIDLKLAEAFAGSTQKSPESWTDACTRSQLVNRLHKLHQSIHIPLATRVVPTMETFGFVDLEDRSLKFSSYQIEGQTHGRMSTVKPNDHFIIPHNLSHEKKIKICPGIDKKFITFDYRYLEPSVLQWLSGDEKLKLIIQSGRDLYSVIYSLLSSNRNASEAQREFAKQLFLPIVYGIQADALAEKLSISKEGAKSLIKGVYGLFPKAMNWVEAQQGTDYEDCFGRRRVFEKPWVARNAAIQGPAAMICQEKLIKLHDGVNGLCANIHDAYVLAIHKDHVDEAIDKGKKILEEPANLGLDLKVNHKIGDTLE